MTPDTDTPDGLVSGRQIAALLDISHSTWGRWVAAGKAPEPAYDGGNGKLYRRSHVVGFLKNLALLDGEVAA